MDYKGYTVTYPSQGDTPPLFTGAKEGQPPIVAGSLAGLKKKIDTSFPAPVFGQAVLVYADSRNGFAGTVTGYVPAGRGRYDQVWFLVTGRHYLANSLYHDTEANRKTHAEIVRLQKEIDRLGEAREAAGKSLTHYTSEELLGRRDTCSKGA